MEFALKLNAGKCVVVNGGIRVLPGVKEEGGR